MSGLQVAFSPAAFVETFRQRPATASGITFLNVEDETGLVNVICSVGLWGRYRRVVRESRALIIRGTLERSREALPSQRARSAERLGQLDRFRPFGEPELGVVLAAGHRPSSTQT